MRPTHVMVAVPIDCQCSHRGASVDDEEEAGICPDCGKANLRTRLITLEEFAKLFYTSPLTGTLMARKRAVPNEGGGQT